MEQSLYEYISESIVDGRLPDDFCLPKETTMGVAVVDGFMEGVLEYHRAPGHQLTDEQKELVARGVEEVSSHNFYQAEEIWWQICEDIGPYDAREYLQQYIRDHANSLNLDNLGYFAHTMATRSPKRNVVKLALCVLGVFRLNEDGKSLIRTLGLSDEFTFYAARAMGGWDNINDELFDLAKKVRGWGRIHLIGWLSPQTEEIRHWILREGVHNTIMPAYSAINCWVKGNVPKTLLSGEVTREDFCGIRDIIEALLDEGPVVGISGIGDAEEYINLFLEKAKKMTLDNRDHEVIGAIREHFTENAEIAAACEVLLGLDKM